MNRDLQTVDTTRESILSSAKDAVSRDRCATHGQPENSFQAVADLWNAYMKNRKPGPFQSYEVAIFQDLLKTARISQNPSHPDHWTDKAGYAACGGEIACNALDPLPDLQANENSPVEQESQGSGAGVLGVPHKRSGLKIPSGENANNAEF